MSTRLETMPPIVPFWNRLREMVLYPASMSALAPILFLGLAHIVIFMPLGLLLLLLVKVAMYRVAFDCLRATANGQLEPPESRLPDDSRLVLKLVGLLVVMLGFVIICQAFLGGAAATLAILMLGLALPGATITLAMEQQLSAAVNPLNWLGIVSRIGWPYLAAVGLCLVVFVSQEFAASLIAGLMPRFLSVIVAGVISNYALVVAFHLLGYLVYQYHVELGFEPKRSQLLKAMTRRDPDQEVLDEVAELIREGQPEAAAERLKAQLRSRGGTNAVHAQFRKLLRVTGDKEGLLQHGHEYLPILVDQEKARAAVALVSECQTIDPAFAPARAADVSALARLAAQAGHTDVALKLLSGFHKRFPRSKDIAQNYLLVATLMHERMGQDDKARRVLLMLKSQYPGSPVMPAVDELLATVERMLATARQPLSET